MKKIMLLFGLCLAIQMHAQEFHFIPKVGLNLANLTKVEGNVMPGVTVGMGGEILFNKKFALEPGIFFSMQGAKVEGQYIEDDKYKLSFLNIPVLAKGYLVKGFHVFTGPQFGFNINSKLHYDEVRNGIEKIDIDYLFKSFNLDLVMGLGYQFDFGLLLSANYNLGLLNQFEKDFAIDDEIYLNYAKTRNSVFQINLGWRF